MECRHLSYSQPCDFTLLHPVFRFIQLGVRYFQKLQSTCQTKSNLLFQHPIVQRKISTLQSAKINGELLDAPWFTHDQLMNGGILELEMGAYPNKSWGTDVNAAPPSRIE